MLEKKTKLGDIRFSKNVISRIVEDAVAECNGNVELFNYRGKYKTMVPSSNMDIEESDEGLIITAYIVIRFGAGIKHNTKKIIDYIHSELERAMGEKPKEVKIIVTGIKSKEIARRHIVINE